MAPTLVTAAFGALLAAALLGAAFDRRSVAVVVAAAVLPDADAAASLVVPGATNALLHTVWIPLVAGGVLYWDTTRREESRLRARYGVVDGRLLFSTQDGIVQTFVAAGANGPGVLPLESPGTTASHAIPTWTNPDGRPGLALGTEREFHFVRAGWQAVVVAAAGALLAVRSIGDAGSNGAAEPGEEIGATEEDQ